jgi:hypothetical protein
MFGSLENYFGFETFDFVKADSPPLLSEYIKFVLTRKNSQLPDIRVGAPGV